MSCIFCKIIQGEIPSAKVHEDPEFIAIKDIQPHAPVHVLVMPKRHIASLDEAFPQEGEQQVEMIGKFMQAGARVAREQGLMPNGYRAVLNTNAHAGQTVFHIHLHILGGAPLRGGF